MSQQPLPRTRQRIPAGGDPRPVERENEKSPRPLRIELLEERTAPIVIWGDSVVGCP